MAPYKLPINLSKSPKSQPFLCKFCRIYLNLDYLNFNMNSFIKNQKAWF
jgi:hypothetical protein